MAHDTLVSGLGLPDTMSFTIAEGPYNLHFLTAGCYIAYIIARYPKEGNRSNDTASSMFTIFDTVYSNDVAVERILSPDGSVVQPDSTIPVIVQFVNTGKNSQSLIPVRVTIVDRKGNIVDYDSATILNWKSGDTNVVTFYSFTPRSLGTYTVKAEALLPNDEAAFDNVREGKLYCGKDNDLELTDLLTPKNNSVISNRDTFRISGSFRWMAYQESRPSITVNAWVEDSDRKQVFSVSGSVGPVSLDSGLVFVTLPNDTLAPITGLPPGRYTVGLFASNGKTVSLTVKQRYNVVLDSIRPQYYDDTVVTTPTSFAVYATNQGINTLAESQTKLELWDSTHIISKWISTQKDWKGSESRRIDFDPVPTLTEGYYQALVYAPADSENTHYPEHLTSSFYLRGPPTSAVSTQEQIYSSSEVTVEIFDLLGRRVFRGRESDKPALPPGAYIERRAGSTRKFIVP